MTPTADESCDILRAELEAGRPFLHTKWGDGAMRMVYGLVGSEYRSADGERGWSDAAEAQRTLLRWWNRIYTHAFESPVFMGDWNSCSDPEGLNGEWATLINGNNFRMVQYEALLLHRLTPALLNFYAALKACGHKKLLVTSGHLAQAGAFLGADVLLVPAASEPHPRTDVSAQRATGAIMQRAPDIVMLCCGGIGAGIQPMLIEAGYQGTQINLGSALDPLFLGRTRSGQVDGARAREYFSALL